MLFYNPLAVFQVGKVYSKVNLADDFVIDLFDSESLEICPEGDSLLIMPNQPLDLLNIHPGPDPKINQGMPEAMMVFQCSTRLLFFPGRFDIQRLQEPVIKPPSLIMTVLLIPVIIAEFRPDPLPFLKTLHMVNEPQINYKGV